MCRAQGKQGTGNIRQSVTAVLQNLAHLENFYHTLGFVSKKAKFKNFVCPLGRRISLESSLSIVLGFSVPSHNHRSTLITMCIGITLVQGYTQIERIEESVARAQGSLNALQEQAKQPTSASGSTLQPPQSNVSFPLLLLRVVRSVRSLIRCYSQQFECAILRSLIVRHLLNRTLFPISPSQPESAASPVAHFPQSLLAGLRVSSPQAIRSVRFPSFEPDVAGSPGMHSVF